MRHFILAGTIALAAMAYAGAGAQTPAPTQNGAAQADETDRLNQEVNERIRRQTEERARVEARIRQNEETSARIDAENERNQREYEERVRAQQAANAAEQARYNAEMERFRAQEAERLSATRGGRSDSRNRASSARTTPAGTTGRTRTASAGGQNCAQQTQRNRRRGRSIGGALGGVAGIVGGRNLGTVARIGVAAVAVPVGALIGDAIASRLTCREQEQAAEATEQAMAGGVGTTVTWRSETRPNVTGTSTVTAVQPPPTLVATRTPTTPAATTPGATTPDTRVASTQSNTAPVATTTAAAETSPCLTVTDVIIVDGEETRAPKTMCRRPPTNRYVRV